MLIRRRWKRPTPDEWAAAAGWEAMLGPVLPTDGRVRAKLLGRKLRLLICAAARTTAGELCGRAVEVAERFADGLATAKQRATASADAEKARVRAIRGYARAIAGEPERWPADRAVELAGRYRAMEAAEMARWTVADRITPLALHVALPRAWALAVPVETLARHGPYFADNPIRDLPPDPVPPLVRDVFGYPFRPAAFDRRWRTTAVWGLADGVAADGTFDRLPILADALEDAGCDDAELLAHLRGPGPHVRGCWAVDVVRGVHWQPRAAGGA
jgi:hypothetical protein